MNSTAKVIMDQIRIEQTMRRMAYEIYENNEQEKELIVIGVRDNGSILADQLSGLLQGISPISISRIDVTLDKIHPSKVVLSQSMDFNNRNILLVDDVANSGKTLLYAMKPLLEFLPKRIQTAVLVDRMHKSYPVMVDFIGHSLSTTLQENILVHIHGTQIQKATLS